MREHRGRRVWLLVAIAIIWLTPSALPAATPTAKTLVLPTPARAVGAPPPVTGGLTVTVDATAYLGVGYCPIKVTVNAAAPSPADRSITVQIGAPDSTRSSVEVSTDLEIPAGATSVSTVLHVPHFVHTSSLKFDFWEDGEQVADLCGILAWYSERSWAEVLCPNSEDLKESESNLLRALMIDHGAGSNSYSPYDLPETTFDYSSWGSVLISIDELNHVVHKRPQAWKALRLWVVAGGNLRVYGMSHDFKRLPELEKLLELSPAPVLDSDETVQATSPCWQRASLERIDYIIETMVPIYAQSSDQATIDKLEKERAGLKERLREGPFVLRGLGMGYVAALDTNAPTTEHDAYWFLLTAQLKDRDTWHGRHQISFDGNNAGFWNFSIPGVGLPPIVTFEVLITLFVIIIGPVNFFLLQRRHKQSLLVFTVPAAAAVVTGCLLLYAIFGDGLGIRARSRSFTEIDQQRGEAVCWSRIAYYAGLQPSRGLEFPLDTEVYPIEQFSHNRDAKPDPSRTHSRKIEENATRRFTKGWLPARTITQFLTCRARVTAARLDIAPSTDGTPPRVFNRLGTRIEQLLVIGADGKCSWAETIADGAAAQTSQIEPTIAVQKLRTVFVDNALTFPPSWNDRRNGLFNIRRGQKPYNLNPYSSSPAVEPPPGPLLEEGLGRTIDADELTPRTYVAIVERSPEFELGLDHVGTETSYHVVLGHW